MKQGVVRLRLVLGLYVATLTTVVRVAMNAELIVFEAFCGQVTVSMAVSGNSIRAVCQVLVSVTRTVK